MLLHYTNCIFTTNISWQCCCLCRWWRGRELQQKFEKSTKGCREKEKREDCSKELTPRFFLLAPHSSDNFTTFTTVTQLSFDCGRCPHSFHYVPHPFPSFVINSANLLLSLPSLLRAPSVWVWMQQTCLTAMMRTLKRCQEEGFLILKSTRCTFPSP